MKVDKSKLSKIMDKLKSVAPKINDNPALTGILVQDGYLVASDHDMTVKVLLEESGGEDFILPQKSFDMIKSLPEGEVEITSDGKDKITIKMGTIKNSYRSHPSSKYSYSHQSKAEGASSIRIDGDMLRKAIHSVLYAVAKVNENKQMTALCIHATGRVANFVGLEGHMIAWASIDLDGDFKLLIPRKAAEKVLSLGIQGDAYIQYNDNCAIFCFDGHEIYTRLQEGEYFPYQNIFVDYPDKATVQHTDILNAMGRANLISEEKPVIFDVTENGLNLKIKEKNSDYFETVQMKGKEGKLIIGFNPRLVLETIRAHTGSELIVSFGNSKSPMIIESDGLKSMVLPVNMGE